MSVTALRICCRMGSAVLPGGAFPFTAGVAFFGTGRWRIDASCLALPPRPTTLGRLCCRPRRAGASEAASPSQGCNCTRPDSSGLSISAADWYSSSDTAP
eukprot:6186212-Amphidinium_carterae.2